MLFTVFERANHSDGHHGLERSLARITNMFDELLLLVPPSTQAMQILVHVMSKVKYAQAFHTLRVSLLGCIACFYLPDRGISTPVGKPEAAEDLIDGNSASLADHPFHCHYGHASDLPEKVSHDLACTESPRFSVDPLWLSF